MSQILDSIEKTAHKEYKASRAKVLPFSYTPAIIAFLVTPFMIAKFIYVPVFGQLVTALNLLILILYFRERRNQKVTLSILCSIILSVLFLIFLGANFGDYLDLFIGTLMTLSIAVSLLTTFLLSYQVVSMRIEDQ